VQVGILFLLSILVDRAFFLLHLCSSPVMWEGAARLGLELRVPELFRCWFDRRDCKVCTLV
jgi:hypothetical protein